MDQTHQLTRFSSSYKYLTPLALPACRLSLFLPGYRPKRSNRFKRTYGR